MLGEEDRHLTQEDITPEDIIWEKLRSASTAAITVGYARHAATMAKNLGYPDLAEMQTENARRAAEAFRETRAELDQLRPRK